VAKRKRSFATGARDYDGIGIASPDPAAGLKRDLGLSNDCNSSGAFEEIPERLRPWGSEPWIDDGHVERQPIKDPIGERLE
jgi:hypothetical protein